MMIQPTFQLQASLRMAPQPTAPVLEEPAVDEAPDTTVAPATDEPAPGEAPEQAPNAWGQAHAARNHLARDTRHALHGLEKALRREFHDLAKSGELDRDQVQELKELGKEFKADLRAVHKEAFAAYMPDEEAFFGGVQEALLELADGLEEMAGLAPAVEPPVEPPVVDEDDGTTVAPGEPTAPAKGGVLPEQGVLA